MKEILKSKKLNEILSLAQTKDIAVYIVENDQFEILNVDKLKKDLFLKRLLEIFPALQPYDLESCDIFNKICATDLTTLKNATKEVINTVPSKKKEIMYDYIGVNQNIPLSYSQIAEKYGLASNYVYQSIFREFCEKLFRREGKNLFLKKLGIIELTEKNCLYLHNVKNLPKNFHYVPHLPISTRALNALMNNNFVILEQLTEKTENELLRLRKIEKRVLEEIKSIMKQHGLFFSDEKIENEKG